MTYCLVYFVMSLVPPFFLAHNIHVFSDQSQNFPDFVTDWFTVSQSSSYCIALLGALKSLRTLLHRSMSFVMQSYAISYLYPPQTMFVGGYTVFTLSVRPNESVSVTFCFLNILESL